MRRHFLFWYPVLKINGKLGMDAVPVLTASRPFLCDIYHGKIQHFQQAVIGGKDGLGFCHFPELAVEPFNGVGRIDQPSQFGWEFEVNY